MALLFLLCAGWIAYLFLFPRSYNVNHLRQRAGTKYWTLATGSHIAYTLVPAKGEKKKHFLLFICMEDQAPA
jgi:hypothetical protein